MKRREKPYSLEDDLALDGLLTDCGMNPSAERRLLIDRWEEYDPGGKKAHAITMRMMYAPLTTA